MVYKADTALLEDVLADVERSLGDSEMPAEYNIPFLIAVEEIFVNVAHYAYKGKSGEVEINLNTDGSKAQITFIDSGIAFNPLAKEDPDINASVEERPIGGLGIYMVKKSMDGIEYERKNDKNILKFWKNY